jgi:ubiquinone/menaquinone biosynthesis C-methylase UbiE
VPASAGRLALRSDVMSEAVNEQQRPELQGLSGGMAGLFMLHRPSNRARARWVLSLIELASHEKVLDLGIGPGYSTGLIAESLGQGVVVGVDRSPAMIRIAQRRLARFMKTRTVMLMQAEILDLPNFNVTFDKVVAIKALRFDENPQAELAKLHARMTPGGRIAVAVQPSDKGAASAQAQAVHIADCIREAGFDKPQTHFNASLSKSPCICVVARA